MVANKSRNLFNIRSKGGSVLKVTVLSMSFTIRCFSVPFLAPHVWINHNEHNIYIYIWSKVNLFEDQKKSILLKTLKESNSLINWNISSDLPSGSLAITVELLSTPALFSLSSVGELERVEGGVPQEKNTPINKEKK